MWVYLVPEKGKNAVLEVLMFLSDRTIIDRKIVVSSAGDGTSQFVCTHC